MDYSGLNFSRFRINQPSSFGEEFGERLLIPQHRKQAPYFVFVRSFAVFTNFK